MDPVDTAAALRDVLVDTAGRFMTSPELAEQEQLLGVHPHGLYFRGRSAVLGDPPAAVVAAIFGIFPTKLVKVMLDRSPIPADTAVGAFVSTCWQWGRNHLAGTPDPARAADLLYQVVDRTDLSALPLVAGWQAAPRPGPGDHLAALAHALNLARELRGALHFCALRANALTAQQAIVLNPHDGRRRLIRIGWRPADADALITSVTTHPHHQDLQHRWHQAEAQTTTAMAQTFTVLTPTERADLTALLTRVPPDPGAR